MAFSYHTPRELRVLALALVALIKINLATQINSLARYSKRKVQPLKAAPHYNYWILRSFHTLLRVLFRLSIAVLVRYRS